MKLPVTAAAKRTNDNTAAQKGRRALVGLRRGENKETQRLFTVAAVAKLAVPARARGLPMSCFSAVWRLSKDYRTQGDCPTANGRGIRTPFSYAVGGRVRFMNQWSVSIESA